MSAAETLIHVRYDEIALKGGRRTWYEDQLRRNVARMLGLSAGQVERTWGRLLVRLPAERDTREALAALGRTFGVKRYGVVRQVEPELETMRAMAVELARPSHSAGARRFKVNARRADKRFPIGSYELCCSLEEALL